MTAPQHLTPLEATVIALAQGRPVVHLDVRTDGGTCQAEFCGMCGRLVCHPGCPRASAGASVGVGV